MCVCVYVYIYMCMCVYVCMYVCMHIYIYVCVCIYINNTIFYYIYNARFKLNCFTRYYMSSNLCYIYVFVVRNCIFFVAFFGQ